MSLVQIVNNVCMSEMDKLAQRIQYELKSACPKRTGEAATSIGISAPSEFTRRIGGVNDHLFFADQGNNQSKSRIYPKNAKALPISGSSGQWIAFRAHVSTYEGSHFVRDVADKHR